MREITTAELLGKRALGEADCQDIVDWAATELVNGHDTKHLRILAGLQPPLHPSEVESFLDKAFNEIGLQDKPVEDVLYDYADSITEQLVQKTIDLHRGRKILYKIFLQLEHPRRLVVWDLLDMAWTDLETEPDEPSYSYPSATKQNFPEIVRKEAENYLKQRRAGNADMFLQVRQFASDHCSEPIEEIDSATRLEDDLGISGDEASEFMEAFQKHFDVDMSQFQFNKHFSPEGISLKVGFYFIVFAGITGLLWAWKPWTVSFPAIGIIVYFVVTKLRGKPHVLRIKDLVEAAKAKEWIFK